MTRAGATAFSLTPRTAKRRAGHFYPELLRNERLPAEELARRSDARASAMAGYAFDRSSTTGAGPRSWRATPRC